MSAYLDETYFDWLYGQVCSDRTKSKHRTFRKLLYILYTKEFVWLVPNDDNRVEDGRDLRFEFLEQSGVLDVDKDAHWLRLECSFLEFLIALSRRLEFETDREASVWFWELMINLELQQYNDAVDIPHDEVEDVLNRVIWRQYNYNGGGGLFPLVYPEQDQRKVEIWYQQSAYVLERM